MRLCVQNGGLVENFSHDEYFKILKDAGFDSIDLNLDHILTPTQIKASEHSKVVDGGINGVLEFVKPVKEASEKYGIAINQIHTPFPTWTFENSINEEYVAYVKLATELCFEAAKYLDCHYCVVHPQILDDDEHKKTKEDEWNSNIEFYTSLIPSAKKNNVIICLENLFYRSSGKIFQATCSDFEEANKYIKELNKIAGEKRFGFCLDVGHATLIGKDIYNAIMAMKDNLCVLHVHDNDGVDDLHLFPYVGVVDWNRFIKGIADSGYTGAISFETFNQLKKSEKELAVPSMIYLGAIGRYFTKKIEDHRKNIC